MKPVFFAVVVTALILAAMPMSAVGGGDLWQIGRSDGPVIPEDGALEYPATRAWTATFDYYVGVDPDPVDSPSMPGYIGPANVCDINPNRPCTDAAAELNIHFTLDCHYNEGELVFTYDRYGSESDNLYLDCVFLGTVDGTVDGGFQHFEFDLGSLSPGDHTITFQYAGGGDDNGHYIDYLKLISTFYCASVDIKPQSCPNPLNTKSNGVLPVAVLGIDEFDVYDVDPSTVTLEGVAALRWAYEDVATPFDGDLCDCTEDGPDGLMDLTLKFETQDIVAALGSVTDGEYRPLTFEGGMYDGYPIYGEDCVWIRDKGDDPGPPPVISVETFGGTSSIIYLSLGEATEVSMVIYDVRGKRVRTLVNGILPSGDHKISWTGRDEADKAVANGVYFCRVKVGTVEETVKMLLMK
jgi:hypothetical protein